MEKTEKVRKAKPWYRRLWQRFKQIPHRLAAIPESPHEIAKAFAVGVFVGILPGTGMAAALIVAVVFRMSKAAAMLGALVTNPWTAAFFYAASYKIGIWFTRLEEPVAWRSVLTFQEDWHGELLRATPTLLIGAAVLGSLISVIFYGIVRTAVTQYRKARLRRMLRKK